MEYIVTVPDMPPPRPLLCFLHGYDEGAPMEIEAALTRHGPLNPSNPEQILEQFIVVAPQLPRRGDLWHTHAAEVKEMVEEVQRTHDGDVARTYLTGFSFGGNGVFDLAAMIPDMWAALWAVDPTRVPRRDAGLPVWLSIGEVSRRGKEAFIEALGLKPRTAEMCGRVFTDEMLDHVQTAASAYSDPDIYQWLLRHRSAAI